MMGDASILIRNDLKAGDIEEIISLHGFVYAQECGFDKTFEQYVSKPLREFAKSHTLREKIWIIEQKERIKGCIAVVKSDEVKAQLRWFLVHPDLRGKGVGRTLINEAIQFVKDNDYSSIFLWTVSSLKVANKIYTTMGFQLTEEKAHSLWGKYLIEQRYELVF